MPSRILLVEDDVTLRETIAYNLRNQGYDVLPAADGPAALEIARREGPDLMLLDVMLPGIDGFEVCRILRKETSVPILMLTARSDEIDRVVGLEMGADDYLGKPFAMRELLARIRAMLRRMEMMRPPPGTPAYAPVALDLPAPAPVPLKGDAAVEDVVALGDLVVDRARRTATLRGEALALRPKEFDLLYYLARHPDVVHSRDVLLHRVWGYDFPMGTRTVDVHVRWLRQKIEPDPSNPTLLETVRGVGYRLVSERLGKR